MPPVIPTRYLEISSVPLSVEGAWMVTDYTDLLAEAPQRGEDRIVDELDGQVAYPRRRDAAQVVVPISIFGVNDVAGAAHADEVTGLEANVAYLNANVVAPTGSGDGTRAATLHLPGGNLTASVHVVGLTLARKTPVWIVGALRLSIPAGRFA